MANIQQLCFDGSTEFWLKIRAAISSPTKIGVFSDDGLIYVVMSNNMKMVPFVRKKEELFSTTINRVSKKYRVIINGQFYGLSNTGKADALIGNDPVDPVHTTPEGLIINNGKIIGGRSAPQMFYIANYWKSCPQYRFNSGTVPTNSSSGVGGCGPIIVNGLPYGALNTFSNGVVGKTRGQPIPKNKPYLTQRSNNTFAAYVKRPPYTGKTIIALSTLYNALFILVQPHSISGMSLPFIRDKLKISNIDNAVFLDGSDSSLLVVDGEFITKAGENKDETNIVGIGFGINV